MINEMDILIRILAAAGLGALVGFERERQSQPAGLRTHIVVVVGATLAMVLSINLAMQFSSLVPNGDPARLAAQVLSGIGFLGAGAILRFGSTVKGLTTAASLWTMAVVGLAVGAGYLLVSAGVTVLLLVVLTVLTWVEKRLMTTYLTLQFTIYAVDRPGLATQVRQVLSAGTKHIDSFRLNRHVRRQRLRVDSVVMLPGGTLIEKLSDDLSAIQGVKMVKYE
jgi:putative Mg2+ transporter-C (MgtC) family protein